MQIQSTGSILSHSMKIRKASRDVTFLWKLKLRMLLEWLLSAAGNSIKASRSKGANSWLTLVKLYLGRKAT
jgi:hypothetical protein